MSCRGLDTNPLCNGSVDVVTRDLLQPGAAKITGLASVAQPWITPGSCQSEAGAAQVCVYTSPRTFYKVAGQYWKSTGFTHPVTGEFVLTAQVQFIWPEVQTYSRAARFIEARYIQYKVAKRQKLVALKHTLHKRAVYDKVEAANLPATAKYTTAADMLWHFIIPAKGHPSSIAGNALLYAKTVQSGWLNENWGDVTVRRPLHSLSWGQHDFELWWLNSHSACIDSYAAAGTSPTRDFTSHLTRQLGESNYEQDTTKLNCLLDVVTCYAYWTTIKQHELAGTLMMHNRSQAAIDSDSCTQGALGSLAYMQPELLQVILMHLNVSHLNQIDGNGSCSPVNLAPLI